MAGMVEKPKRRRFRLAAWSAVALLVATIAWGGYSLSWIRQRHVELSPYPVGNACGFIPKRAPSGLWLFGESGFKQVVYYDSTALERRDRIIQLFPEAKVIPIGTFLNQFSITHPERPPKWVE